jgi:hypothetical protein
MAAAEKYCTTQPRRWASKNSPQGEKQDPVQQPCWTSTSYGTSTRQEKQRQSLTVLKLEATLEILQKDKNPTTAKGLITKKTKFCS